LNKVASPDVFIRTEASVGGQPDATAVLILADAMPPGAVPENVDRSSSHISLAPPPTDLVVSLQHFII